VLFLHKAILWIKINLIIKKDKSLFSKARIQFKSTKLRKSLLIFIVLSILEKLIGFYIFFIHWVWLNLGSFFHEILMKKASERGVSRNLILLFHLNKQK